MVQKTLPHIDRVVVSNLGEGDEDGGDDVLEEVEGAVVKHNTVRHVLGAGNDDTEDRDMNLEGDTPFADEEVGSLDAGSWNEE